MSRENSISWQLHLAYITAAFLITSAGIYTDIYIKQKVTAQWTMVAAPHLHASSIIPSKGE